MDNPETLVTMSTQVTLPGQIKKNKTQNNKQTSERIPP
jgi:hypothetical protein